MWNHEQIVGTEEIHVLEDEVSLLFHSQLIWQMKHQYSTGRVKHTRLSQQWLRLVIVQQRKKIMQENTGWFFVMFSQANNSQCKNGSDTFLLFACCK